MAVRWIWLLAQSVMLLLLSNDMNMRIGVCLKRKKGKGNKTTANKARATKGKAPKTGRKPGKSGSVGGKSSSGGSKHPGEDDVDFLERHRAEQRKMLSDDGLTLPDGMSDTMEGLDELDSVPRSMNEFASTSRKKSSKQRVHEKVRKKGKGKKENKMDLGLATMGGDGRMHGVDDTMMGDSAYTVVTVGEGDMYGSNGTMLGTEIGDTIEEIVNVNGKQTVKRRKKRRRIRVDMTHVQDFDELIEEATKVGLSAYEKEQIANDRAEIFANLEKNRSAKSSIKVSPKDFDAVFVGDDVGEQLDELFNTTLTNEQFEDESTSDTSSSSTDNPFGTPTKKLPALSVIRQKAKSTIKMSLADQKRWDKRRIETGLSESWSMNDTEVVPPKSQNGRNKAIWTIVNKADGWAQPAAISMGEVLTKHATQIHVERVKARGHQMTYYRPPDESDEDS